jgi:hypothetical protein
MHRASGSWALAASLAACTPSAGPAPAPRPELAVPEPASESAPAPSATETSEAEPQPRPIADDAPLGAGLVEFSGFVRPTKGGLDVRGVTFALEALQAKLPEADRALSYDELLGAELRVVAELEAREADQPSGDLAVQTRSGHWLEARRLVSAEVLKRATLLEGEVGRSKGFLTVGKHLVTRDDLSWALRGVDPVGKRVRLWGQPRVQVCAPAAQCLIGGALPMFDVARAELVK